MYGGWKSHGNAYNEEDELLVSSLEVVVCREGNNCSVPERKDENVKHMAETEDHPFCNNELCSAESLLPKKIN